MIIKKAEYKVCSECGYRKLLKDVEYGCDWCKKPIDYYAGNYEYLSCTVFHNNRENERYQFCSWKCFFAKLPELETDFFIDFPTLNFEMQKDGCTVADFWRAVTEVRIREP